MTYFNELSSRYIFKGKLKLLSDMHIGAGYGKDKVDSLFVNSNGGVYIPGSSLRGALRSGVECILSSLDKNTCILFGEKCSCPTSDSQIIKDAKSKAEAEDKVWDEKAEKELVDKLCDTCKVFGSTIFSSKIRISDLYPQPDVIKKNKFGVAIDRDTETASDTALFTIQTIDKQAEFDFELIAENIQSDEEWGVLAIALKCLTNPDGSFSIGAKKAVGLGKCYVDLESIQYFDKKPEYTLKDYLVNGTYGELENSDDFLNGKIEKYIGD